MQVKEKFDLCDLKIGLASTFSSTVPLKFHVEHMQEWIKNKE